MVESYPGVLATFGEATTYPTGGLEPIYVKTGDLNNDNIPDVVTGNFRSDSVSIFLGKGNGTFEVPARIPTGDGPNGVNIGDFNKDGAVDVVSGPYWYEGPDFTKKHEYRPAKKYDPKQYYCNSLDSMQRVDTTQTHLSKLRNLQNLGKLPFTLRTISVLLF